MASKRDLSDLDEGEVTEPEIKRKRKNYHSGGTRQHQNSSIDSTWGQKYVFSGYGDATTIPPGEESDFEDDAEAMAYLMSVRQEASDIPHLLVAPKVQIGPQLPPELKQDGGDDNADGDHDGDYEYDGGGDIDRTTYTDGTGDARGYYEDGAYISLPGPGEGEEEEEYDEPGELTEKAIHEAYFASILEKYSNLRDLLNSTRPPDAYSRLPPSTATEAAPFGRNSFTMSKWSGLIRKTDPLPLQIALISKDSVLRILRVILSGKFLRQGQPVSERTSRWLWALLARLPERGEMTHVEIGWVRDLGRRAVLLGRSLAEMAALREELEDGGLGVHEYVDGSSSDEEDMAEDPEVNDGVVSPTDGEGTPDFPLDDPKKADSTPEAASAAPADQQEERKQTDGPDDELEEGEISEEEDNNGKSNGEDDEDEDVAMEIASNSSVGENEASSTKPDDLEAAKARLLAQVDQAEAENDQLSADEATRYRARMNMRATVNMILTIAGEFYGQRDLLEFREPFVGM
ncbi:unnamed protein product [Clonostachys chloroleuca]|uniref:V-snare n=1 Tax=Clonostachys chloroleuca TaxID=1926264 RepID=A0AA35Q5B6_9HYPO|nr:unnamed protein product [Clonostachys chloroleuca]